jgi:hypothetical protein
MNQDVRAVVRIVELPAAAIVERRDRKLERRRCVVYNIVLIFKVDSCFDLAKTWKS